MKTPSQFLLALLALIWTASQAAAIPGRAEVKKVVGKASFTKAGGTPASLAEGMVLGTGDTVITGAGATVDLYLGLNGDFLRVDPDTTLKIDSLDIANVAERTITTQLSLGKGGITGNVVNKLTGASKYEIRSATGVAGIRGTVYSVRTDANGRVLRIVVTQGTVTFVDRGQTITISANDGTAKGYTPSQPGQPVNQNVEVATQVEATATITSATLTTGTTTTTTTGTTTTTVNNPVDVSISRSQ